MEILLPFLIKVSSLIEAIRRMLRILFPRQAYFQTPVRPLRAHLCIDFTTNRSSSSDRNNNYNQSLHAQAPASLAGTTGSVWKPPTAEAAAARSKSFNPDGYERMRAELAASTQSTMSMAEFHKMCAHNFGAVGDQSERWLRRLHLHEQHVLLFEHSPDEVLRETIVLNPRSEAARTAVATALDIENSRILGEIAALKAAMPAKQLQLQNMLETRNDLDAKAAAHGKRGSRLLLLGMLAQFPVLGYGVWGIWSWDIMEPFCYFYMLGTAGLGYVHFLRYRQWGIGMGSSAGTSSSWSYVFRTRELARRRKGYDAAGFDDEACRQLDEEVCRDMLKLEELERKIG